MPSECSLQTHMAGQNLEPQLSSWNAINSNIPISV